MSFSSGFRDGFSYYMALADEERKKRKEAREIQQDELYTAEIERRARLTDSQIATQEIQRQSATLDLEARKDARELSGMTLDELSSISQDDLTLDQYSMVNKLKTEALQLSSAEKIDEKNRIALEREALTFESEKDNIAILKTANIGRLLSDGDLDPIVAASQLEEPLIELRNVIDFTKYRDPEYMRGWNRITPFVESGDFETIATTYKDDLSRIFADRFEVFKGKRFVTKDGSKSGVIESVGFDGDFIALENSPGNMAVGGSFNVRFDGEEEVTKVSSFLPDNAANLDTITESQALDDAKVVSVRDVVDKTAAEKDFAMFLVKNPKAFQTFLIASKGQLNFKGDPEVIKQQIETYKDFKRNAELYIGNLFKNASEIRAEGGYRGDSLYYKYLYDKEPNIAQEFIDITTDNGDTVYKLKEPDGIGKFKNAIVAEYANPEKIQAEVANLYTNFGEIARRSDGRKPFYFVSGVPVASNLSREEADQLLSAKIKKFDEYKELAAQRWSETYPEDLDTVADEIYLAYISAFIAEQEGL
jgi:hypothetical protein|tara:strand:- start:2742 stop:4343 length:1602 start_codon:yes stop_codon:yes gene_type:complete